MSDELTATTVLNAGYTYTGSKEPDGTRLTRLPRHSLVVGVTAHPIDRLSVNVTGQYVADTLDTDFNLFPSPEVHVDDRWTVFRWTRTRGRAPGL